MISFKMLPQTGYFMFSCCAQLNYIIDLTVYATSVPQLLLGTKVQQRACDASVATGIYRLSL